MKNSNLLGVSIAVLVLLVAPTIPAQEYKQVKDTIQIEMNNTIDDMMAMVQIFNTTEGSEIEVKNMIWAIETVKDSSDSLWLDTEPAFFGFIISTLISLFFALLGTIFGIVFGPVLAFIIKVLTAPAVFLAKLISFLLDKINTKTM